MTNESNTDRGRLSSKRVTKRARSILKKGTVLRWAFRIIWLLDTLF